MGKPKASSIDVPDPIEIINAQKEANRTDTITPFGQSVWQGNSQVTSFSPEMQAMADQMMGLASQGQQRVTPPAFLNDIGGAIAGRVGERYGLSGLDTSKPQSATQAPQPDQYAVPGPPPPAPPPQAPPMPPASGGLPPPGGRGMPGGGSPSIPNMPGHNQRMDDLFRALLHRQT
jgi:hypothetical protein